MVKTSSPSFVLLMFTLSAVIVAMYVPVLNPGPMAAMEVIGTAVINIPHTSPVLTSLPKKLCILIPSYLLRFMLNSCF